MLRDHDPDGPFFREVLAMEEDTMSRPRNQVNEKIDRSEDINHRFFTKTQYLNRLVFEGKNPRLIEAFDFWCKSRQIFADTRYTLSVWSDYLAAFKLIRGW